jgi:hypothetical protein
VQKVGVMMGDVSMEISCNVAGGRVGAAHLVVVVCIERLRVCRVSLSCQQGETSLLGGYFF